jgi:hypothetical protein
MTEDEINERKKLCAELRAELLKRQLSNAENFDRAILTYSSAGLAISLAFLKDFIPIAMSVAAWLLYLSWALFVVSSLATLASFLTSQFGIKRQLDISERYYLRHDNSAIEERNLFAVVTERLTYVSGAAFGVALVCTTIFVSINLERSSQMPNPKQPASAAPTVIATPSHTADFGAPIPTVQTFQASGVNRGAPVPGIQPIPTTAQPATPAPGSAAPVSNGSKPGTVGQTQPKP